MPLLEHLASYVRSKNAGPFWVTIDIFCDEKSAYDKLSSSVSLGPESIGRLYQIDPSTVRMFPMEDLKVLKISFPRPTVAGAFRDRDAHAGQYFVPLLSLEIS